MNLIEMLEFIKFFAAHGANYCWIIAKDPRIDDHYHEKSFYSYLSPFYAAIRSENLEIVKYLVDILKITSKESVRIGSVQFLMLLMLGIKSSEITKFLIEAGCGIERSCIQ